MKCPAFGLLLGRSPLFLIAAACCLFGGVPIALADEPLEHSGPAVLASGAVVSELPAGALEAVDTMFRAGQYRVAAREYAVLALRFGATDQLYGRRFVAQVMNRSIEQAVVIHSTARLMGNRISRDQLPGGMLPGLGIPDGLAMVVVEQLAAHAAKDPRDLDRLEVVVTWLRLAGDDRRAQELSRKAGLLRARLDRESASPILVEPF